MNNQQMCVCAWFNTKAHALKRKVRALMTPEGRVESHLKRQCDKRGVLCYKFTSPSNSGVPDRIIVANGKVIFLELKAPDEEPRKLQRHVMKALRKAGADVRVADTNALVDAVLDDILS